MEIWIPILFSVRVFPAALLLPDVSQALCVDICTDIGFYRFILMIPSFFVVTCFPVHWNVKISLSLSQAIILKI